MSVEETLKGIVTRIVHCDEKDLTPDNTWQDLKADSLDLIQILVAVEDTFGIEIPDEDTEKMKNFYDFVAYIEGRLAEKGESA
ncbi:acyl carrier protein [Chloroflexota bacterium]